MPDIHTAMLANFKLARADYVTAHKSAHWDIFASDYEKVINDTSLWRDFRRNGITTRIDFRRGATDASTGASSAREVAMARSKVQSLAACCGMDFIRDFHEGIVGNPPAAVVDGMRISISDLRLVHDAWRISTLFPKGLAENAGRRPVVLEIGGGYGGLAAKLKWLFPNSTIVLLDLPEVNAIQHYYLSSLFPDVSVIDYCTFKQHGWNALAAGPDFAVFPGWVVANMPPYSVDLAVNTRSMMEMNSSVVRDYMAAVNRIVRPGGIFYCVNRYAKWTVGESIRVKNYPFDDRWFLTLSEPAWDQPWMHELAAVRTERQNVHAPNQTMATLPPFAVSDLWASLAQAWRISVAISWGAHHNVNPGIKGMLRTLYRTSLRRSAAQLRRSPILNRFTKQLRRYLG